jgi:hypothetical protein
MCPIYPKRWIISRDKKWFYSPGINCSTWDNLFNSDLFESHSVWLYSISHCERFSPGMTDSVTSELSDMTMTVINIVMAIWHAAIVTRWSVQYERSAPWSVLCNVWHHFLPLNCKIISDSSPSKCPTVYPGIWCSDRTNLNKLSCSAWRITTGDDFRNIWIEWSFDFEGWR